MVCVYVEGMDRRLVYGGGGSKPEGGTGGGGGGTGNGDLRWV